MTEQFCELRPAGKIGLPLLYVAANAKGLRWKPPADHLLSGMHDRGRVVYSMQCGAWQKAYGCYVCGCDPGDVLREARAKCSDMMTCKACTALGHPMLRIVAGSA